MGLFKKKPPTPEQIAAEEAKSFFDCICPSTVKFFPHHYMEISADAANPFPILHNKLNLEECNMKKKVMITLAALAAAGAAVTGCICLANSKVYGYGRFR